MRKLKYLLTCTLLLAVVSCSEPDLPFDLDETLNSTGAFLRVTSVEMPAYDFENLAGASYAFTAEYFDNENSSLLEEIVFYASYEAAEGQIPDVDRTMVKAVPASALSVPEGGELPAGTFEVTLSEANSALGISSADNLIGDTYRLDWELHLTDGRVFGWEDMSQSVTGGFYNSPNFAVVNMVAAVPQDMFVGEYTFTQVAPAGGVTSAYNSGWLFEGSQTFTAELEVDPDNFLVGRVFSAAPWAEYGIGPKDYPVRLLKANNAPDNSVSLAGNVGVGLSCGGPGIYYGGASSGAGDFTITDDSAFQLVILDNSLGGCGFEPEEVTFTVTKN